MNETLEKQKSTDKKSIISFSSSMVYESCMGLISFKDVIQEYVRMGRIQLKSNNPRSYFSDEKDIPIIFEDECCNNTGILKLNQYEVAYSKELANCDDRELELIIKERRVDILKEYVKIAGFSELEINLMERFKDFCKGVYWRPKFENGIRINRNYIDENYIFHSNKNSIKENEDYLAVQNGFYTKGLYLHNLTVYHKPNGEIEYWRETDEGFFLVS